MAPTICQEKKRQIRSSLKEIRRQPLTSSTAGTTNTSTSSNSSNSSTANSTIINYVAKGSLNSRSIASLRVRGIDVNIVNISSTPQHLQIERLAATTPTTNLTNQNQQISDSSVSSSTQLETDSFELLDTDDHERQTIANTQMLFSHSPNPQYFSSNVDDNIINHSNGEVMDTDNDDDDDDDDAALHSLDSTQRQLLHCTVKTVSPIAASQHHNNNNKTPPQTGVIVHNSNSCCSRKHDFGDSQRESDTFSHMCEIKNTEGLLAIALKTIKLVKRNQLLQRRLAQLQLETSEFIQSVLANPENRHFRDKMQTQQQNATTPPKVEKLEWKESRVAEV